MADERNRNLSVTALAGLVVAVIAIASPFVAVGQYKQGYADLRKDVDAQEEKNKIIWANLSNVNQLTTRHEALIPVLQQDVKDIKSGLEKANETASKILLAVKR